MTEPMPSQLKPRLLVAAAIFVLGTLLFIPFLLSGTDTLIYAQDQLRGIGSWQLYAEYLRKGILPVWWGSQLGGSPVYESMPGEAVYPFSVLSMLLVSGAKRVGLLIWAHTLLSGGSAYLLGRRQFQLGRFASVLLSTLWMFNPYTFSLILGGHVGKYFILAILPLTLLGLLRFLDTGRIRWAVLVSATLGWMLFTTHVQLVYFALWGLFLLWLAGLWASRKSPKALLGRTVGFWVAIALGIGLGAPILLPATGFVEKSTVRGEGSGNKTLEHAGSWALGWEDIPALVVPEFVGVEETYWGENPFKLNTEAPGLALLVLGIAGVFLAGSARTRTAAGIGGLAILFGLGTHTPLLGLAFKFLPGVDKFRAPSMILFWLAAGMLLCVGALLQSMDAKEGRATQKQRKVLLWISASLAGLGVLLAMAPSLAYDLWSGIFPSDPANRNLAALPAAQEAFRFGALRAGIVAGGCLFALRQYLSGIWKKELVLSIWLVLGLVDLWSVDHGYLRTTTMDQVFPGSTAAQTVEGMPGKFRVIDFPPGAYQQGYQDFYHLENAGGFSDVELRWYRKYREAGLFQGLMQGPQGLSGSHLLDILNVKYLLYKDSLGRESILPNLSALPRAWVAPRWSFATEDQVAPNLQTPSFDHRSQVILLQEDRAKVGVPSADSALHGHEATIQEYQPGRITIIAQAATPSLLFLADSWYSAWHATVDGVDAPVLRADLAFRAVPIPAGSHTVEFRFHNPELAKAWTLGGLALLSLVLLGAGAVWRKAW